MNVVGLFLTCNSADVIELLMRHHAELYDRLVVVDDSDADGTPTILKLLQEEGLPITVWSSGMGPYEYRQRQATEHAVKRICEEFDPDFIMIHDEDEFCQAGAPEHTRRSGARQKLEEGLATIPDTTCGYHMHETYVPVAWLAPLEKPVGNPLLLFRKRLPEGGEIPKVILPRAIARHPGLALSVGSHVAFVEGIGHLRGVKMTWGLAHVPVRRRCQLTMRQIVAASKVCGSEQEPPRGGYAAPVWLREHGYYSMSFEALQEYAMRRAVFDPANAPTHVDEDSRMVAADNRVEYWDKIVTLCVIGRLERAFENLSRAYWKSMAALEGRSSGAVRADEEEKS